MTKLLPNLRPTVWVFLLSAGIGGFSLSGCGVHPGRSSDWSVKVGDPIPEFSLQDPYGKVVSSDSLKGKPYAIAIYATWCPPCRMELDALEKNVWQPLKEQGISVLGINFGDEDAGLIRKFGQDLGVTFPLLIDETGSFRQKVGVTMVPQSLVVGCDGRITDLHVGYTDDSIDSIRTELEAGL